MPCEQSANYAHSVAMMRRFLKGCVQSGLKLRNSLMLRHKYNSVLALIPTPQCAINTGTVIDSRIPRVAPPSTNSRNLEWPYPPMTIKSAAQSAA